MKIQDNGKKTTYGSNFKAVQAASSTPNISFGKDLKNSYRGGLDYSRPRTSRSSTRAPIRSTSSGSSRNSGSSRSSGYSGNTNSRSSSGSRNPVVSTPKTPPAPAPPSASQWLNQDTTYQGQVAQMRKAYADFLASQGNDKNQYQNQYGLNVKSLGENRTQGFDDLLNDYAGRGLLNSGVYGKAYSDLQTDYDSRQTQLDTQRQAYLQDQATNLSNFKGDQSTATTSAKQEALARRAAKYGG
jgi:hypothetical protein